MRVNGRMEKEMVMELPLHLMENLSMLENSKMTNLMVKEYPPRLVEKSMKENSRMGNGMVKEP